MYIYCLKESNFNQDGTNYVYLAHERNISGKDFHGMVKKVHEIIRESFHLYINLSATAEMMCERYGFQIMKPHRTMDLDYIPNEYKEEEDEDVHL